VTAGVVKDAIERRTATGSRPGPEGAEGVAGLSGVALRTSVWRDRLGSALARFGVGFGSAGATFAGVSPSAALRARAALRRPVVYAFQWGLHIRPRPSFWLGWAGKSVTGASCASIPNLVDPMHLRMSVISLVLSLANADLALRRTSITLLARRCKPERSWSHDESEGRRSAPGDGLAQPDRRFRRGGA
jgi:hypothetical protein